LCPVSDPAEHVDDDTTTSQREGPFLRWGIAAMLLVAAVVRFGQLNAQSLTSDEVKDLAMARGGVAALAESEDRFPPLYHALLGAWLRVVPWDTTGRGFSAVCGVLTVAAIAGLGGVLGGRRAALCAGGLAAVAPLAVWYSVEARAYGLYMLLATVALWQFTAAMKSNAARHWAAFAAAAIAGAYAHYYFGLLVALAGIVWLGARPRGDALRRGLATFAVIAVATAPSLWLLNNDLDQPWGYARTSRFSVPALGYTYFSYLSGYTLGPSLGELHTMTQWDAAADAAPWMIVVGFGTAVLLMLGLRSLPPNDRWRAIGWAAAFCLAPAAIIGAVSGAAGFGYNVRHAVWAFTPLATALGVGAAHGRPRWLAWAAVGVVGAAFAVAHVNRLRTLAHANEDIRSAGAFLTEHGAPVPTFVLSGYMDKPLTVYLPADWPVIALPDAGAEPDAAVGAVAAVRARVRAGETFWLIYTREFHGDPRGELLAAIEHEFDLEQVATLAGVHVYRGRHSK
jgi:hypothetical protein